MKETDNKYYFLNKHRLLSRMAVGFCFVFCVIAFFPSMATASAAKTTTQTKKQQITSPSSSSANKKASSTAQKQQSSKKVTPTAASLNKFSAKSLGLAPIQSKKPKKGVPSQQQKIVLKPTVTNSSQAYVSPNKKLTFEGAPEKKDTFLAPRRAALPGSEHTLSQFDQEEKKEMTVRYKMNKNATARLAVNEENINSPLYAPLDDDEMISSAGMYMDVKVKKNLQMQMGAELRNAEGADSNGNSQGASVGLRWSF